VASLIGLFETNEVQVTYIVVFLANEILLRHTMSKLPSSKERGAIGVVAQLAASHLVLLGLGRRNRWRREASPAAGTQNSPKKHRLSQYCIVLLRELKLREVGLE